MIVAGEASGDRHGAALARALRTVAPETEFHLFGSGGEEMRAADVETLVDARDVAIMGIPEIARGIGRLYRAYRDLLAAARERRPAAVVLIDWPDFNMRLARRLHRDGLRVVYYISPQVWAWRRYRVRALRRDVDRMLVILPFEVPFYAAEGLAVEYVGHPLVDSVRVTTTRAEFCRRHELDETRPIIALLPGSRQKEIHYHVPVMIDAARRLQGLRIVDCGLRLSETDVCQNALLSTHPDERPGFDCGNAKSAIHNPQSKGPQSKGPQFILPLASTVSRERVTAMIPSDSTAPPIIIVEHDTYNSLFQADFAIVASGTATVETALAGTPMVIIYRASELNWRLIRPMIHLDTFGMVNLIAGRKIIPELMQHEATGERIAAKVREILGDPARLSSMRVEIDAVRQKLAAGGTRGAERAARAVLQATIRQSA